MPPMGGERPSHFGARNHLFQWLAAPFGSRRNSQGKVRSGGGGKSFGWRIFRDGGRQIKIKGGMVLPAEVEELIASLRRQIAALEAEVAELRRQLGQDSSNSSKPPSSDGLRKKSRNAGSLRGRFGQGERRADGPQGRHVAASRRSRLRGSARGVRVRPLRSPLDPKSATGIEKRQVFDLAERPLMVTEHQASIYRCAHCRGETKAAFPDGVVSPVQYGERVKAAAIYLNIQQLIPEDRAAQALSDLFGAPLICPASIVAWVGKKAQELGQRLSAHRRARGRGESSPSRRNRVSHRRQAAMAAHHVEPDLHLLSRRRKARRDP